MCARQHKAAEVACCRTKRTLMGLTNNEVVGGSCHWPVHLVAVPGVDLHRGDHKRVRRINQLRRARRVPMERLAVLATVCPTKRGARPCCQRLGLVLRPEHPRFLVVWRAVPAVGLRGFVRLHCHLLEDSTLPLVLVYISRLRIGCDGCKRFSRSCGGRIRNTIPQCQHLDEGGREGGGGGEGG